MRIIAFITDPREVVKILPRSTIERGKGDLRAQRLFL
jgi:hypothetical protein